MSKGISTNELNMAINRLEKEAGEMVGLASVLRAVTEPQGIKESLDSTNKSLREKIEKRIEYFNVEEEKLKKIELTVISEEEKAEARIADIKKNEDSRIEGERARADKRIEEIRDDANKKEQETQSKLAGFGRVTSIAEKAASEAVAKREEAENAYQDFKTKMLV